MNWRRFIPYLYFCLDLGVVRIQTSFMYQRLERMGFEYIGVSWEVLNKWKGTFTLYSPWRFLREGKLR